MTTDPGALLDDLHVRLLRYPPDRYPVQHATLQVQVGVALLQQGDASGAVGPLRTAVAAYPAPMLLDRARAANLLGVAYRDAGRATDAVAAFTAAAAAFAEADHPLEEAAAGYNLGLALRDEGKTGEAAERFSAVLATFESAGSSPHAAASARELAAALLELGEAQRAADAARRGAAHAERAADIAGLGAAENVLGLAELAAGRPGEAAEAFRRSAAAHPRTVRPEGHAMARANLALACERLGDRPRARLAAQQAIAAPEVPTPVHEQASGVLARLGEDPGDLHAVLAEEPPGRWPAVLREELEWWPEADESQRSPRVTAFVEGLAGHDQALELAHAWLGVLLELPPRKTEALVRASVGALARRPADVRERVRSLLDRTLPRFPLPQWQRLTAMINDAAAETLGEQRSWL